MEQSRGRSRIQGILQESFGQELFPAETDVGNIGEEDEAYAGSEIQIPGILLRQSQQRTFQREQSIGSGYIHAEETRKTVSG